MGVTDQGLSITESQLIERCREKQPDWESELVEWLGGSAGWLHRRCIARLGCEVSAEDAAQDVSIKLLQAIDQFEGRSTLRTWVKRIADNHCNTLIQRQCASALSDHLRYSLILMDQSRVATRSDNDKQLEIASEVNSALQELTELNQEVLQLRFFFDLSLDEMATSMNLSLSATKMRLYRAMDAFKQIYTIKREPKYVTL